MTPLEILENGTLVSVNGKHGKVISSCFKKDQFGEPIASHTIHFFEKYKRLSGYNFCYEPINEIRTPNYAGIQILSK